MFISVAQTVCNVVWDVFSFTLDCVFVFLWFLKMRACHNLTSGTKVKRNVLSSFLKVDKPIYFVILTLSIVFSLRQTCDPP